MAATALLGAVFALARRCEPEASTWRSSRSASARPIELLIFDDNRFTGGYSGTAIGKPHMFGLDIDGVATPAATRSSA